MVILWHCGEKPLWNLYYIRRQPIKAQIEPNFKAARPWERRSVAPTANLWGLWLQSTDSLTLIDCFYRGLEEINERERQEVEPVPLNRSWRGRPICYRKLNKHLSACMLCSAQSLPCLRVWGPNSGFKVQPHNLLAKQILNSVAIKYEHEWTAVIILGQSRTMGRYVVGFGRYH